MLNFSLYEMFLKLEINLLEAMPTKLSLYTIDAKKLVEIAKNAFLVLKNQDL